MGTKKIIWKEEPAQQPTVTPEKTFTLEEISAACARANVVGPLISGIIDELQRSIDPQYELYLELKKKFEKE